jgi:hypothetical protein
MGNPETLVTLGTKNKNTNYSTMIATLSRDLVYIFVFKTSVFIYRLNIVGGHFAFK